jgi:hypothetical protein
MNDQQVRDEGTLAMEGLDRDGHERGQRKIAGGRRAQGTRGRREATWWRK